MVVPACNPSYSGSGGRKIMVDGKVSETLSAKQTKSKRAGVMAQVVQLLPGKRRRSEGRERRGEGEGRGRGGSRGNPEHTWLSVWTWETLTRNHAEASTMLLDFLASRTTSQLNLSSL
jgi:hypothetical protein